MRRRCLLLFQTNKKTIKGRYWTSIYCFIQNHIPTLVLTNRFRGSELNRSLSAKAPLVEIIFYYTNTLLLVGFTIKNKVYKFQKYSNESSSREISILLYPFKLSFTQLILQTTIEMKAYNCYVAITQFFSRHT